MPDRTEHNHRPLWQLAVVLLLGVALAAGFVSLGVWQVQRLAWKRDLIERVENRVSSAPVAWTDVTGLPPDALEYRPVTVTGEFDHSVETLVQAVTEQGGGFWVLTPLRTDGRETVLINRGFVPSELRDPSARPEGQVTGEVTVTGLARLTEPDGAFLRENDHQADRWFSRDIAAIADAKALPNVAGFFVDADATPQPGGYPVGGLTVVQFRNAHLSYALTWFALAGMVIFGIVLLLRHENRARRQISSEG
ncbi:SURF1 family protein [Paracoccus aerodenitrificans]|uniref:SURF1 family protein n=1 Tax=Paracoccus aerodenitrificans TaxID=3017781 RepID=UPI0022F05760|nr:SURF1 family protein [Paracoccus aerodenitrificans]WBU63993.1 SURF1 family protein [Paracoccus aerodenitrificans]